MSVATLNFISSLMKRLDIPCEFMRWTAPDPEEGYFFTYEYTELPTPTREETGKQDISIILRGFTRRSWLLLEQAKEKIEKSVAITAILPDGTGIAVFYDGANPVPTGDADFKSIKINLTIQEWKVN